MVDLHLHVIWYCITQISHPKSRSWSFSVARLHPKTIWIWPMISHFVRWSGMTQSSQANSPIRHNIPGGQKLPPRSQERGQTFNSGKAKFFTICSIKYFSIKHNSYFGKIIFHFENLVSEMWYAVSIKYTLESEDLVWKKNLIANIYIGYMLHWL